MIARKIFYIQQCDETFVIMSKTGYVHLDNCFSSIELNYLCHRTKRVQVRYKFKISSDQNVLRIANGLVDKFCRNSSLFHSAKPKTHSW
jgi:arginine decarboxylase-like protein